MTAESGIFANISRAIPGNAQLKNVHGKRR